MDLSEAKTILVVGCSGGGKSTLTQILSQKYDLPAVHLDIYFWQPGWTITPMDKWREKVKELTNQDKWVMDGTFSESFDLRFPAADKIIILKLPRLVCLYRAITRVFKYSKKDRRPDMAEGCDETFDFKFYQYIWTYDRKVFPKITKAIEVYNCEKKVVYLKSHEEVEFFVRGLR